MKKAKKVKLISRLLSEGWFETEKEAAAWAMARKILVDDQPIISINEPISPLSNIRIKEYYKTRYVNKGGLKLEGALLDFSVNVSNLVCLDCGASTGGFTDCLLTHGASKVYAVDVGYGQIAGKLQNDPRVINMERTNLSDPILCNLSPAPQLITLDLSYLSLKTAIPLCQNILEKSGEIIALVKPLFEVASPEIRQTGIIDNPNIYVDVLEDLYYFVSQISFNVCGITYSHVRGNSNTLEYFMHISSDNSTLPLHLSTNLTTHINDVVNRSLELDWFKK